MNSQVFQLVQSRKRPIHVFYGPGDFIILEIPFVKETKTDHTVKNPHPENNCACDVNKTLCGFTFRVKGKMFKIIFKAAPFLTGSSFLAFAAVFKSLRWLFCVVRRKKVLQGSAAIGTCVLQRINILCVQIKICMRLPLRRRVCYRSSSAIKYKVIL